MKKRSFYYGWVIAIICFLIFFTFVGINISPTSLFIVPVTEYFGFSRGDFSISLSLVTITGVFVQLIYGLFINRFGVRGLVSIGVILAPIGFFINYRANSLGAFYTAGVIIGISFALTSITSVSIVINNWFNHRQGLLLGVISSGSGFGGGLFSIVIGSHMEKYGFKSAYFLITIVMAVFALPIVLLFRSKPKPDQQLQRNQNGHISENYTNAILSNSKLSAGEFIKKPTNILALLAIFIIGITFHPVVVSTPAYLVEKGFEKLYVAAIVSTIFMVLGVAKVFIGMLHDKLGIRTSLLIGFGTFLISVILLITARRAWLIWLFVVFQGISFSTLTVVVPLYVKEILGNTNYSHYLGVFVAALSAGTGIGIPIINYTFDLTGSYTWIIMAFGILATVGYTLAIISLQARSSVELLDIR